MSSPSLVAEDFKISSGFTPEDYQKNWSDQLCDVNGSNSANVFNKFYKHVWDLLFASEANEETRARAIALLVVERPDAAFHNPYSYNDWIRTVKEEVIKRGMTDLWKNDIIPKRLGLIWALDSDYFDDLEDPEPAKFYKLKDSDPEIVWNL